MDKCLNDDDDEDNHRLFFASSGAQHESLSVHAGSVCKTNRNALHPEHARRITWPEPVRDHLIPAPAGTYGRLTGQ